MALSEYGILHKTNGQSGKEIEISYILPRVLRKIQWPELKDNRKVIAYSKL